MWSYIIIIHQNSETVFKFNCNHSSQEDWKFPWFITALKYVWSTEHEDCNKFVHTRVAIDMVQRLWCNRGGRGCNQGQVGLLDATVTYNKSFNLRSVVSQSHRACSRQWVLLLFSNWYNILFSWNELKVDTFSQK